MNYLEFQQAFDIIREFYDQAWTSILWILGVAFAIEGIAIPIIQYRAGNKRLSEQEKKYKATVKEFGILRNQIKESMGGIFFMQGNSQLNDKNYGNVPAYRSFLLALEQFSEAKNEDYIHKTIDMLINISNKEEKSELKALPGGEETVNKIVDIMLSENKNDRYTDDIFYFQNLFDLEETKPIRKIINRYWKGKKRKG